MASEASKPGQPPADYSLAVCILASGSRGNAIYIADAKTAVLLDAGLSGAEIQRRMAANHLAAEKLDAIIVSHEHADHIQGVGVLSRRYHLPVYINRKTHAACPRLGRIQKIENFECGRPFHINSLRIHPFSVSHDAADPAGFTIGQNGTFIGIATDLGLATAMVREHLKKCVLLIVEANHDPIMLATGPYPWPLKQRIKGRSGHLSNEASKILLEQLCHDRLQHVILAHLSQTNNTPQKALEQAAQALAHRNIKLSVAEQDVCGPLLFVR